MDPEYTIIQSIPNSSLTLIKPSFDALIFIKITCDLNKFNAKFYDGTNLKSGTDTPIP
jgi:hypothetical protein